MSSVLIPLKPQDVAARLAARKAVLVDIREPDEFARRRIRGALSRPLNDIEAAHLQLDPEADVIFTCRTGVRTGSNCDRLARRVDSQAFVLEGGLDAWVAADLPVEEDRKAPLEIIRQVQIGAGSPVLLGVVLSLIAHPAFVGLSALVGAGLVFAGISGFCGMAKVLALAPWNRRGAPG